MFRRVLGALTRLVRARLPGGGPRSAGGAQREFPRREVSPEEFEELHRKDDAVVGNLSQLMNQTPIEARTVDYPLPSGHAAKPPPGRESPPSKPAHDRRPKMRGKLRNVVVPERGRLTPLESVAYFWLQQGPHRLPAADADAVFDLKPEDAALLRKYYGLIHTTALPSDAGGAAGPHGEDKRDVVAYGHVHEPVDSPDEGATSARGLLGDELVREFMPFLVHPDRKH